MQNNKRRELIFFSLGLLLGGSAVALFLSDGAGVGQSHARHHAGHARGPDGGRFRLSTGFFGEEEGGGSAPPDHQATFDTANIDQQLARMESDPEFVAHLLEEYRSTPEDDRRAAYLALLTTRPHGAVKRAALELASRGDVRAQRLGLALLFGAERGDRDVLQAVGKVLAATTDETLTLQATRLIFQKGAPAAAQRDVIKARLSGLLAHQDGRVRAEALNQYATIAPSDDPAARGALYKALGDNNPLVALSALDVINRSGVRSDDLRDRLFALLRNPRTDAGVRGEASALLLDYDLSDSDRSFVKAQNLRAPAP